MSAENGVFQVGYITEQPTMKQIPSKKAGGKDFFVAEATIAVNKRYKKEDGTVVEQTCFTDLIFKGEGMVTKMVMPYVKRGSHISIAGELAQQNWITDGVKKSKHVIEVDSFKILDRKAKDGEQEEMPPMTEGEDGCEVVFHQ